MITTALQVVFAFAWDLMLVALIPAAAFVLFLLLAGGRPERFERGVDRMLTFDERRAGTDLYPTSTRQVLGVHKKAPEPLRTDLGRTTGGLISDAHQE